MPQKGGAGGKHVILKIILIFSEITNVGMVIVWHQQQYKVWSLVALGFPNSF